MSNPNRRRRWPQVLGVIAVLLGGAYFFLMLDHRMPADCSYAIDLTEVRRLASSLPGEKPHEIRVEKIAGILMPEAVIYTGGAFAKTELSMHAYALVSPQETVIADTGMTVSQAKAMKPEVLDEAAIGRVSKAMATASKIVVTHEHADHMGGALGDANLAAFLPALTLTREQLSDPRIRQGVEISADTLSKLKVLDYDKLYALRPGVVLIKAPGHTPGSQLVYVQRADGKEAILLGDVAWHRENLELERTPPRLVTLLMHADRNTYSCELKALHGLEQTHPEVTLIPNHDEPLHQALYSNGLLKSGFQ